MQRVGGFEIGVDPADPPADGEVSMGGDSGSVWLQRAASGQASGEASGLHFAGESGAFFEQRHSLPELNNLVEILGHQVEALGQFTDFIGRGIRNCGLKFSLAPGLGRGKKSLKAV